MDFEPTDDQVALQSGLRRFLADRVTPEARRAMVELPGAVDNDLWRELAGMGVFALTQPEATGGGAGGGRGDAGVRGAGPGRCAGAFIGTFLAAGLERGDERGRRPRGGGRHRRRGRSGAPHRGQRPAWSSTWPRSTA